MPSDSETITDSTICVNILMNLLFSGSFLIYYIYSYVVMIADERDSVIGKVFLSYIVSCGIYTLIVFIDIVQKAQYTGCVMRKNIWRKIRWVNRFPLSILKLSELLSYITGLWIASVSDHCVASKDACHSMQIITVFIMILPVILGFAVIMLLLCAVIIGSCKLFAMLFAMLFNTDIVLCAVELLRQRWVCKLPLEKSPPTVDGERVLTQPHNNPRLYRICQEYGCCLPGVQGYGETVAKYRTNDTGYA